MSKYIDADTLKNGFNSEKYWFNKCMGFRPMDIEKVINGTPAADVEPVEHGEWWNECDDYSVAKCSNCGTTFDALDGDERYSREVLWKIFKTSYSYCPNCGAKMDESDIE